MTFVSSRTLARWFAALLPAAALAAPVSQPTPVHVQPDANASVLTVLSPGAELSPAAGVSAPFGWQAVQVPGPHDVYVDNKDITKALDVRPGSAMRARPAVDAPIVATASEGDAVEITGLRGRWTQLRLSKAVTGFVQGNSTGSSRPATPPPGTRAEPPRTTAAAPAATSTPAPATGPGRAVPMTDRGDGGVAALPRLFEGRFVSTRAPLRPRRPYDFALEDPNGNRIAYVDTSKLLLTDQIENYVGRAVAAYGTAKAVPDTKDIVITAESLQLR